MPQFFGACGALACPGWLSRFLREEGGVQIREMEAADIPCLYKLWWLLSSKISAKVCPAKSLSRQSISRQKFIPPKVFPPKVFYCWELLPPQKYSPLQPAQQARIGELCVQTEGRWGDSEEAGVVATPSKQMRGPPKATKIFPSEMCNRQNLYLQNISIQGS